MKKILNFLFSFSFMGFLLLILAFSMAIATFVESSYGTEVAQGMIYKSFWFGLVLFLLAINLLVNFIRRRMYTRQRIPVGLFHLSFIIILLGAAITRFISFEGMMHIREGESSNFILSTEEYLTIKAGDQVIQEPVLFSEFDYKQISEKLEIEDREVKIESVGYIKNAIRSVMEHPEGSEMIDMVLSSGQGRENVVFSKGKSIDFGSFIIGYDVPNANVQFISRGDSLLLISDRALELRSMTGGEPVPLQALDTLSVQPMNLYAIDNFLLIVKDFYPKGVMRVSKDASGQAAENAVVMEVSDGSKKQIVNVMGIKGMKGEPFTVNLGNTNIEFTYGPIPLYLPFSLHLTDFQLERYPGSESPASFASELILNDSERKVNRNVRVFMNNTLNYRGYKFFQSSYDQDERGTVLSVNADQLGTTVTYIGYALLGFAFILALFSKNSYFQFLASRLKKYSTASVSVIAVMMLLHNGQASANEAEMASIPRIEEAVLKDFSRLWIQGPDGRIEPVSTLSSEVLRKVSRQSAFYNRPPEEVILSLRFYPELWRSVALVYVPNKELREILGVTQTRVPLTSFFDEAGNYKLIERVKAAFAKPPGLRNMLEKELINVDERIAICFMIINGDLFALFPGPHKEDKWYSAGSTPIGLPSADSLFVNRGFELLKEALEGKGEITASQIIASTDAYQQKFGESYLSSENHKKAELVYNKVNPFKRVFPLYLLTGFVLLIVLFVNIFRQKKLSSGLYKIFFAIILLGFLLHMAGLIMRWYISGHAPWSNGYESMIYIAWATMLAGILFGRKYPFVITTATILSGIILFVAHLNWMNPEITQLVPVLNSYWLMIHVAIITASYGFLGLSAFLGLLVLIMYSLSNKQNGSNLKDFILQLTTINEMSVTIGLYMLTIGTFLGGVWANESWGRYWGWDSKETWALITVVIYSFIAHMRLIPGLKGIYNYTIASVLGFASVLMTYFGVNYYLSGLHSYGRGSIDQVHWSVFVTLAIVAGIMLLSNIRQKNINVDN